VLVTGHARRNTAELAARTDNNRVVNFAGPASLINRYVDVTISSTASHSLRGELIA
jgi:tRNA-2-methylthio-N6-dimethylallyladenosine synthase